MKLEEIFDTKQNVEWQSRGEFELTKFIVDNIEYVIQIQKMDNKNITETSTRKIGELSFRLKNVSDDTAFSTKLNTTAPIKVYGIVLNALLEKFNEYDGYYFIALKRHSINDEEYVTKIKIYQELLRRLYMKQSCCRYEKNETDGKIWLVTKVPISIETQKLNGLYNAVKEAMISVGFGTVDSISDYS